MLSLPPLPSGVVSEETSRLSARLEEVEEQLGAIDAALHQLEEGTYGTCQSCGGTIADARLAADPTARWCGDCQPASGPKSDLDDDGGPGRRDDDGGQGRRDDDGGSGLPGVAGGSDAE